ncbi:hypothetical protein ACPF8X_11250 [Streptomyces sp. G35A]
MRRRPRPAGALLGTVAAPALASGTARAAAPGPPVTRTGSTTLAPNAFGEAVVDGTRLARDGARSVTYRKESGGTTPRAPRVAGFRPPA